MACGYTFTSKGAQRKYSDWIYARGDIRKQRALDRQAMQLVKACGEVLKAIQT